MKHKAEHRIRRVSAPKVDRILGKSFRILDDGFVRVVDYMGSDASIVQAARVSYGRGTKRLQDDRHLIRYLMRHHHTTPFEMCEIKLHVRVPMDCWRQWIRHRTANVNEYSTRYSEAIDAVSRTMPSDWRIQSQSGRQGSAGRLDRIAGESLSAQEARLLELSREVYQERIKCGVAREQARKDLPLSTYTEAYWKIDLHNLLHFLALRMDDHAQLEIRQYANCIGENIVRRWCPTVWEAFLDYRFNALTLSKLEVEIFKAVSKRQRTRALGVARRAGLLERRGTGLKRSRERVEIEDKLTRLGMKIPWVPSRD